MDMANLVNVSVTPSALGVLEANGVEIEDLVKRHTSQDYGMIDMVGTMANDFSFQHETGQATSVYIVGGQEIIVLTKFNEPITTILVNGEAGVQQEITQEASN